MSHMTSMCVRCHICRANWHSQLCEACYVKVSEELEKQKEKEVDKSTCIGCKLKEKVHHFDYCQDCLDRARENYRKDKEKEKEVDKFTCTICKTREKIYDFNYCQQCMDEAQEKFRKEKEKEVPLSNCMCCRSIKNDDGKPLCPKCLEMAGLMYKYIMEAPKPVENPKKGATQKEEEALKALSNLWQVFCDFHWFKDDVFQEGAKYYRGFKDLIYKEIGKRNF